MIWESHCFLHIIYETYIGYKRKYNKRQKYRRKFLIFIKLIHHNYLFLFKMMHQNYLFISCYFLRKSRLKKLLDPLREKQWYTLVELLEEGKRRKLSLFSFTFLKIFFRWKKRSFSNAVHPEHYISSSVSVTWLFFFCTNYLSAIHRITNSSHCSGSQVWVWSPTDTQLYIQYLHYVS